MANPNTFMSNWFQANVNLINAIEALTVLNDQLNGDSTLIPGYFTVNASGVNATGGRPRTDITATDVTNSQSAFVQIRFTFDSSNPTQKSLLFKMQP